MKKSRFPALFVAVTLLVTLFLPMSAYAVEEPVLTCRNAILIDATYDEVLYDKGAYEKVYPASITKVMTALLVLEAVDAGQLTLDTPITATAEALEVPEDRDFLQAMARVYESFGLKNRFSTTLGTTYAKSMDNCVSWGPRFEDEPRVAHTENERMNIESILLAARIYLRYLATVAAGLEID